MNIAIIGSGLTGSLAAISLARKGCLVDLYERLSDDELVNRDRSYALTHSSRRILEKLNIWDQILPNLISFKYLNVIDYAINRKFKFIINDLNLVDRKYSSIGWIVEHSKLMNTIIDIISQNDNINKIPTSIIRNTNNYDLIIVADGSNSITKKRLKTPSFGFDYDQVCITLKVLLRGIESYEAFEILTPEGPLAILPLGGDMFQIICSQSVVARSNNLSLSKPLFLDYLSTVLPIGIEPDTIIGDIMEFPIKFSLNYKLHCGKYIYLGETAHVLHPVGGQGLNLCWRDVDYLSNIIVLPIFRKYTFLVPMIYSFIRIIDIVSISILTDSLVRYSRSNINVFFFPRTFIFFILKKSSLVRRFILNIMTNGI